MVDIVSEKRKPTYDLEAFKEAFASGAVAITGSALKGAASLGLSTLEMGVVISSMSRREFYKSMTSFSNHAVWQDVYHVRSEAGMIYVKFGAGVVSEFLLLSFKEKDDG